VCVCVCVCLIRSPGWRIHGGVEDTKFSTNKQLSLSLSLSLCVCVCVYIYTYIHTDRQTGGGGDLPYPSRGSTSTRPYCLKSHQRQDQPLRPLHVAATIRAIHIRAWRKLCLRARINSQLIYRG